MARSLRQARIVVRQRRMNPQNIHIYSCRLLEKAGSAFSLEEPRPLVGVLQILSPSLTSNHFPIFEIGSS